jgi:two-component system, sporulation sensor kinase D
LNIYFQKRRWKIGLFFIAILIVFLSLWYTNVLVRHFADNERTNVNVWANAIQRKANLVNYTNRFFEQIQVEEQKRAELLAETYKRISTENNSGDLTFYLNIIRNNTTIPVILTKEDGSIINSVNTNFDPDSLKKLMDVDLIKEFSVFKPINIYYSSQEKIILYYKESTIYTELRQVLDDLIESFFSEVVENSVSVPVIVTDSLHKRVYAFGNIDSLKMQNVDFVQSTIIEMDSQNDPIEIQLPNSGKTFIFYRDSFF